MTHLVSQPRRNGSFTLRAGAATLLALVALALGTAGAAHAQGQADEYQPGPDNIWDLVTPDDANTNHLGNLRAMVFDLEEYNGKVYAAGKFLEAQAPDGTIVSRPHVAAFDVNTGELDPTFAPVLNAPALSITVVGDGTLLIGGEFDGGIVRVDAATGAVDPSFSPGIDNTWGNPAVWDMELIGNDLYAVGSFNRVGSLVRANMVKIDLPSGAVSATWAPTSQGIADETRLSGSSLVWAIASDPGRGRIYVAGKFDAINNDATLDNFAILSPVDGQALTGIPQSDPLYAYNHDNCAPGQATCWNIDNWYYDVQVDLANDTVWLGGQAHATIKMRGSDLAVQKHSFSNRALNDTSAGGDTQTIHIGTTTVWSGCHCWGSVKVSDPLPEIQYGQEYRDMVDEFRTEEHQDARSHYGMDRITGELTPQIFDLAGQAGAYALLEDSNGRLWAGGQYIAGGNLNLSALARFTPAGGVTVSAPTACTVTESNGAIDVSWTRAANDGAVDFIVRRSRNGGAFSWAARVVAPGTDWTNTNVSAGSSYTYTVEARQGSEVSAATTCSPDPIVFGAGSAPVAPTACTVTEVNGDVAVSWVRAANDNADRFIVRRSRDGNNPSWAARVNAPGSAWTDTNVLAGPAYGYLVETHAGNERSVGTTCTPNPIVVAGLVPVAPASCAVVVVGGAVEVSWVAGVNDASEAFIVRRSRDGNNPSWAARVNVPGTSWTDTNLVAGASYTYSVEGRLGNTSSTVTACAGGPVGI
jgi:hypothetical protein